MIGNILLDKKVLPPKSKSMDMKTSGNLDLFLFMALNIATMVTTFFLLSGGPAQACYKEYNGLGTCTPAKVRDAVEVINFGVLQ